MSTGGFAPDVLGAALFFVRTSSSFADALERSIAFAGPSNYCPILVGSIGGARWGAAAVPKEAVDHCSVLPQVSSVAAVLAESWQVRVRDTTFDPQPGDKRKDRCMTGDQY